MTEGIAARVKAKASASGSNALDEQSVLAAYARWAPIYDAFFGAVTWSGRRAALKAANALPPGRVLEAGVGTGLSLPFYDRRHRITGIDLSPQMLERAERRVARRRLENIEALRNMDAGQLAFADTSFDIVVAMYLMSVVPDPERVLNEFVRVIKPGGRLIVVNHFASPAPKSLAGIGEGLLSPFAAKLGWKPDFPLARVSGHGELMLLEKHYLAPFGLFTLLVFSRR